ncbi:hypothetical protein SPI_06038 [Niveomyces insectorum RCEF 264]|uniref:And nb-arc domain containing protein n=1 Tax=Niveomyces insectorum RCEF 264 TaxID=1081102 RepID=A0A167SQQ5_9HYPO|nr:hypothetical protein SPI_06038 [Niveomyces insectorum RCEF 264]
MGSRNLDVSRFEVTGVYTHPNARVDIVLVHGLNGEPKRTWTAKNGLYWPAELLPETLKDCPANVLVYGYNADVYSRGHDSTASDNFIFQHAQTLVTHLTAYRKSEGTSNHPIIWIAHSLGGILVKRTLLYSNDVRAADHEAFRAIYVSTYAIIFLGTPHTGAGLATWGRVLQAMSDAVVPKKIFESESILLKTLKRDNERLQEINNHFLDIYQRFRIHMVHENHKTDLKGSKALIVDADSASPQLPGVTYYGIEATHSGLCKFDGPNAPGYRTITMAIREWIAEAPQIIEVRWAVEAEDRAARARREIEERRMPFMAMRTGDAAHPATAADVTVAIIDAGTSPMPLLPATVSPKSSDTSTAKADPIFVHPERFRPNSYFVGRQKELEDLHLKLTDRAKRVEGTSAVVIHSLPGGGKTHLARQYVFKHRNDYPGGIYWVRAKSIAEMEQFYWKIAKYEALRDVVQKTLGDTAIFATAGARSQEDLCDPQNVVDIVRRWFASFDQWLLVFDGILFNTPGIERFIPDAKNTSIIYTSIQSGASGRYEFDNPQIMKLGMLTPDEGRDLLLTEMEKRKPWTQDDRTRALDLVKLMGCLPLMIHIAAQHLKATREPLSKYMRTYRTRTRAGDLSAYRAVWDELKSRGAFPSLNLMYILAFFDNRIPVGLLHLGIGALDNRTPVMTRDATHGSKSLNNSLRTLIAFALLQRSESDTISPTSSQSSSKRSYERNPDSVDILRIHTVVQLFFVDVLADEKQADFWLERAAGVFCHAFDEAEKLIRDVPKVGLLDDYRCFKIHGEKLLEHLNRVEKKSPLSHVLANAQAQIQNLLGSCEQAIRQLSQAAQKYIVTEMDLDNPSQDDLSMVSVFERASSVSDSESASPSSQLSANNSGITTRTGTGLDENNNAANVVNPNTYNYMDLDTAMNTATGPGSGIGAPIQGKEKGITYRPWMEHDGDGDNFGFVQSPVLNYSPMPRDDRGPYHFHVPYPPSNNPIPAPPTPDEMDDHDDAMTEMPTPHIRPAHGGGAFSLSDDYIASAASHRTVRKSYDRRYHDRAGAWRDRTISDPRISISREYATGSVFVPRNASSDTSSPGKARLTAESEAELFLNRIRASAAPSSPPLPPGQEAGLTSGAVAHGNDENSNNGRQPLPKVRSQSTGSFDVRPLLTIQQADQNKGIPITGKHGEAANASAPPPQTSSSSNVLKRLSPSSPSSWTSTMLKRFKENILPSRANTTGSKPASTPSQEQRQQQQQQQQQKQPQNAHPPDVSGQTLSPQENPNALASSIESLLNSQPGPLFQGSRTANSTPNQGYGPFPPPPPALYYTQPPPHPYPMPSQGDLPTTIHRWEEQIYHPGHQQISSNDLGYVAAGEDPMTLSYPFINPPNYSHRPFATQPPYPYYPPQPPMPLVSTQQGVPQLLPPAAPFADGYTSQPMTRDPSAQSQPGQVTAHPSTGVATVGNRSVPGFSPVVDDGPRHSYSLSAVNQPLPINIPRRSLNHRESQSSLVETEPSPHTANLFPDVHTSYRLYEERHVQGPSFAHSYRYSETRNMPHTQAYRLASGAGGAATHGSGSGSGSIGAAGSVRGVTGGVAMARSRSGSATNSGRGSRGSYPPSEGAPASEANAEPWTNKAMASGAAGHGNGNSNATGGNVQHNAQPMTLDG